jgi:micrococcal nuclease
VPTRPCRRRFRLAAAPLLATAALALPLAALPLAPDPPKRPASAAVRARVLAVFDGDTLRVRLGRSEETVRLIGIDCPELSHPNRPLEFFAEEAAAAARREADGKEVWLATDPSADERDKYERLLRYVTLPDGRLLNAVLVEEGFCFLMTRFPFSRRAEFFRLEEKAKRRGWGVWQEDGLAEVRWLSRRGGAPYTVFPMTRRTWGVRYGDRVRTRLSDRDLLQALSNLTSWIAELSPRDLQERLERAGWRRLDPQR